MTGAFGGAIAAGETEAVETVDASLASLLALSPDEGEGPAPALVPIRAAASRPGELVYQGDLRGLAPLALPQPPAAALLSLERALEALAALHAKGRPHGDLRPAHVWTGAETRLSFPAKLVDASLLLRTRLRAGAEPAETDHAAPEVLRGEPATLASDSFSVAALIHAALHGHAPHGRPMPFATVPGPLARLEGLVGRALEVEPSRRPSLAEIRAAVSAARAEAAPAPTAALTTAITTAAAGPRVSLVASPDGQTPVELAAARRDSPLILGCLLAVGGFFVLLGAIWLAAITWSDFGATGRLGLLVVVSSGVAVAGRVLETKGYLRSGFALMTLATQLLWANGAYLIVLLRAEDQPGHWCVLAWVVAGLTEGLALRRKSAVLAAVAALDVAIASLLLGQTISTGTPEGPAIWCLVMAAILAAVSALGHRVAGLPCGLPAAIAAVLFALGSWALGFAIDVAFFAPEPRVFATLWPYALLAITIVVASGLSRSAPRPYATLAVLAAGLLLTTTPSIAALLHGKEIAYRYAATTIGALLVIGAFKLPRVATDAALQLLAVFSGLASLLVAPSIVCLGQLADKDGDQLARELLDLDFAGRLEHPMFALSYLLVTTGALVVLGLLFARDAERKVPYRALEVGGLLAFLGTLTLLSIVRWQDFIYPAVLFAGGIAALGVGVWQRHMLLVLLPAAFLVVNGWVQYFAKLNLAFPFPLLLLGFGISVLVAGILFERKVKPFLPALRTWA